MTLFDFFSLNNNVNVPSKSNKQKKMCQNLKKNLNNFFAGILKVNDENSRIRIQDPDPLVRGMDPRDPDPHPNVMDPEHSKRHNK